MTIGTDDYYRNDKLMDLLGRVDRAHLPQGLCNELGERLVEALSPNPGPSGTNVAPAVRALLTNPHLLTEEEAELVVARYEAVMKKSWRSALQALINGIAEVVL